jgi:hypothetical protein
MSDNVFRNWDFRPVVLIGKKIVQICLGKQGYKQEWEYRTEKNAFHTRISFVKRKSS